MKYRRLGKTGWSVSRLGFGGMRFPMQGEGEERHVNRELAVPMIHRAFESGVNYVDSAVGYCNQDSQRAFGDALKGWRERVIVSTKNPYYDETESEWWRNLENSLERLQVDYIDLYNHHGINWDRYQTSVAPRVGRWMAKAHDQGLVRHIGCSFHDTNDALIRLVDTGYPEVLTVQYNMLDRRLEDGLAHAHEKGVGVVVMGPIGGGRLAVPSEVLGSLSEQTDRVPELALRFVLSNDNVDVALSGMATMGQVEENVRVASDETALSDEERGHIARHLRKLEGIRDLYCTGCNYCSPCPSGVDIAGIFAQYNLGRVYGLWEATTETYRRMVAKGSSAESCTECGACEDKCPQKLEIRRELKKADRALRRNGLH